MLKAIKHGRAIPEPNTPPLPYVTRRLSMPAILQEAMEAAMSGSGYNKVQRSLWIEEALAGLLLHDAGVHDSATGDQPEAAREHMIRSKVTKTNVRPELNNQVQMVIDELRAQKWDEPNFSFVARCAIRHRLRFPDLYPRTSEIRSEDLIKSAISLDLSPPW